MCKKIGIAGKGRLILNSKVHHCYFSARSGVYFVVLRECYNFASLKQDINENRK